MGHHAAVSKNCATCAFWMGSREISLGAVRTDNSPGKCSYGGQKNKQTKDISSCPNYQKWPVLR